MFFKQIPRTSKTPFTTVTPEELRCSSNPTITEITQDAERRAALQPAKTYPDIILPKCQAPGTIINNASRIVSVFPLEGSPFTTETLETLRGDSQGSTPSARYLEIMAENGITEETATRIYLCFDQFPSYIVISALKELHSQTGIHGIFGEMFNGDHVLPAVAREDHIANTEHQLIIQADGSIHWDIIIKGLNYRCTNPSELLPMLARGQTELGHLSSDKAMVNAAMPAEIVTQCTMQYSATGVPYVTLNAIQIRTAPAAALASPPTAGARYATSAAFIRKALLSPRVIFDNSEFLRSVGIQWTQQLFANASQDPQLIFNQYMQHQLSRKFTETVARQSTILRETAANLLLECKRFMTQHKRALFINQHLKSTRSAAAQIARTPITLEEHGWLEHKQNLATPQEKLEKSMSIDAHREDLAKIFMLTASMTSILGALTAEHTKITQDIMLYQHDPATTHTSPMRRGEKPPPRRDSSSGSDADEDSETAPVACILFPPAEGDEEDAWGLRGKAPNVCRSLFGIPDEPADADTSISSTASDPAYSPGGEYSGPE